MARAPARQLRILRDFVSLPTAPFVEHAGLAYIRRFVAERPALACRADRYGNLLVRYRGPARRAAVAAGARPLVFAAHLDHPGFVARRHDGDHRLVADFRGWVDRDYFWNQAVRFFAPDGERTGRIVAVDGASHPRRAADAARNGHPAVPSHSFHAESPPKSVTLRTPAPVPPGAPGMWDLPACRIAGDRLSARACDDVAGVAAILCMLDELARRRLPADCRAFFTRAEEVGFGGALAAVAEEVLPRRAVVVAIECSKAVTGVSLGAGPVLRVGDRASVFTPAATAFCQLVAEQLAARDRSFRFQRKLMDGGTCEGTVYCHYGYEGTGICLPLANYHNMDGQRRRIAPEQIDLHDFANLVKWFVALATSRLPYTAPHPGLERRLDRLLRQHRPRLLQTLPTN